MQNNESRKEPNGLHKFIREKGYYILLTVCVLAIGVSGYFFVSGAIRQNQAAQETLSVPVKAQDPEDVKKPASSATGKTQTEDAPKTTEEETPAPTQTAPTQATPEVTVMPVSGAVIGEYAMDRLTYNATTQDWRVHNGVDLAASEGEDVLAARNGTVTAVYEDESYGVTVVVQHDDGYTSHYANLSETPAVAAGQFVTAGQKLGTVGTTALLEVGAAPHVHFAVFLDGAPVDPMEFLA